MKNYFNYFIVVLVMILIFRFFRHIFLLFGRFWYIAIPLILILYFMNRNKKQKTKFKANTGLDPKNEVHLKEEPKVEDEAAKENSDTKAE